jgi:hypothetical protein
VGIWGFGWWTVLTAQLTQDIVIPLDVKRQLYRLVLVWLQIVFVKNFDVWPAAFFSKLWSTFFEFAKLVVILTLLKVEYHLVLRKHHLIDYITLELERPLGYIHFLSHVLQLLFGQAFRNFIVHLSKSDSWIPTDKQV